jgi:hypothetical protein
VAVAAVPVPQAGTALLVAQVISMSSTLSKKTKAESGNQ